MNGYKTCEIYRYRYRYRYRLDIDIDIDIWWTTTQVIKEEGKFLLCSIMDGLGGIVLSEISQKKTNIVLYHLNVESKKYKKPKNIIKKKQTHRYREQTTNYHV